MKSQIKLGTVFGVELGLHYSWLIIAILITFSLVAQFHADNPHWSNSLVWLIAFITGVLFFAGIFIHEMSHALVARARGIPIRNITLFMLGGVAQIEKEASDAESEFWMAVVGPLTSATLGLTLLLLGRMAGWHPWSSPTTPGAAILVWLGYINIGLAAFNMVPAFPLDGGRVLHAILWWGMGNLQRSTRVAVAISQFIALLLIAWGIVRFFHGAGLGGLWVAFIGWFLLQSAGTALLQDQIGTSLHGVRVADVMSNDYGVVDPETSIQEFVYDKLLRTGQRFFLVARDNHMLGIVTANEVSGIESRLWPFKKVNDVMIPADKVLAVSPETTANTALETLSLRDINQMPVISEGRIAGVVSRAHILQLLQLRVILGRSDARLSK